MPAAVLCALAGAALIATSLVDGWAEATRLVLGYAAAFVVWMPNAWAGFLWPALPIAPALGGLLAVVGLLAIRSRVAALLAAALGAAASGLLLGVLAVPDWPATRLRGGVWEASPGPMVWVGLGLALTATVAASVAAIAARDGRPRHGVLLGWVSAVVPMAAVALAVAISATLTPDAVGAAGPSRIPPVPDWRTHPEEPYPFVGHAPMVVSTTADGVYTREATDTFVGPRATCRRCAPFPRDQGQSVLTLTRGRYHLEQELPSYEVRGHYAVAGDRITFFNDPECGRTLGVYRWWTDRKGLHLEAIDDPCAFGQRARDLTDAVWVLVEDG
ncbi:MAG TPA: hypothetical protein VF071_01350 [Candidatus Limnocylindria bacterium]